MQAHKEKLIKTLAKIIKKYRTQTHKSIYQISAESFLDNSTWQKIESAKYKDIKLTNIWKIAEGLDIYPDELIKELRLELGKDFSITEDHLN